jgi:pimeloyl-ACP methyl ester carboxylesterase/lysophospholipase L1-like esterase
VAPPDHIKNKSLTNNMKKPYTMGLNLRISLLLIFNMLINCGFLMAQDRTEISTSYLDPRYYLCKHTPAPLKIDGVMNEAAWATVPWTDTFVDLFIDIKTPPPYGTRVKMLWDDQYFYFAAKMDEPHVRADFVTRDTVICLENDFEIFADPDGDNMDYFEFEMNARGTVWDLFLARAYRDSVNPDNGWDIRGLKTGIRINGTLNKARDTDRGWVTEIAIPWSELAPFAHMPCPPQESDRWRVNFLRVEYPPKIVNGKYVRDPSARANNSAWSPHHSTGVHDPESFGIVQFTKKPADEAVLVPDPSMPARSLLMQVYYAQKKYKGANGRYASSLQELGLKAEQKEGVRAFDPFEMTPWGYVATVELLNGNKTELWQVNEISRLSVGHPKEKQTDYYGFTCREFSFEGHDAKIVFPEKAEEQRHWIWRARFWGHEPQTEIALLNKGFHLVYVDAAEYRGNTDAVELWNRFYDYLIKTYSLNPKAVLEGMSRGGLYIYNWGSANTDKVACIYADAPVCDIRSWPGGKGTGPGSPEEWQAHMKAYAINEQTADTFRGMPVYNCVSLAKAHVPVLHVCGATDDVVPISENTYVLEKNFREAGGDIKVIVKEGIGHHPHSLKDPAPIVRFILTNTNPALLDPLPPYESLMTVNFRSMMDNCRIRFEKEKKGRVAFLGGSITWGGGWRDKVCEYLRQRFPETEFEFINAGIPSMGTLPGSMRFSQDVLSKGPVDLLFVEAAVNDDTNSTSSERVLRGMEGIVNQALESNPYMDVVMMHFADPGKLADYCNGRVPVVIAQHEKVAEYYSVNSINLAKEVNDRILNGEFTWRDDFRDLHPSPFGQELYFKTIRHLFQSSWVKPVKAEMVKKPFPATTLDPLSYVNGHFEPIGKAKKGAGWMLTRNWKPTDQAGTREGFVEVDVLETAQPGAELKLTFTGRAIGLLITAGPDAGIVEYSIDGSPYAQADTFTPWSGGLHLPWLVMLEDRLPEGRHRLSLRMASAKNPGSKGTACRIHQFAVN